MQLAPFVIRVKLKKKETLNPKSKTDYFYLLIEVKVYEKEIGGSIVMYLFYLLQNKKLKAQEVK